MNRVDNYLSGKKVLLLGLGRQGGGTGDLAYLLSRGVSVTVADELTAAELGLSHDSLDPRASYQFGNTSVIDVSQFDLIIKNPGVPEDHPLLLAAASQAITTTSSIALFVKYSGLITIGITGTRGKTTTTTLIYQVLASEYPDQVILGGNIPGTSGLALFDQIEGKKYAVLELSSFQLHSFAALAVSPTYAVFTNLYPDHFNRYADMASYKQDKAAIFRYLKSPGFLVYNGADAQVAELAATCPVPSYPFDSADARDFATPLVGEHNRANLAAALVLCRHLGIKESRIKQVFATFAGVPYRFETIRTVGGIRFINDTTATTPVAAQAALRSLTDPTVLICGGASKNLPFEDFVAEIKNNKHVKKVVILGSIALTDFTNALKNAASDKIVGQVGSLREALTLARQHAAFGDNILLSPGFASFDLFKNEFDRGQQFNQLVLAL